jgi:hypothetical protein
MFKKGAGASLHIRVQTLGDVTLLKGWCRRGAEKAYFPSPFLFSNSQITEVSSFLFISHMAHRVDGCLIVGH